MLNGGQRRQEIWAPRLTPLSFRHLPQKDSMFGWEHRFVRPVGTISATGVRTVEIERLCQRIVQTSAPNNSNLFPSLPPCVLFRFVRWRFVPPLKT